MFWSRWLAVVIVAALMVSDAHGFGRRRKRLVHCGCTPTRNTLSTPAGCLMHSDAVTPRAMRALSQTGRVTKAKQLLADAKTFPKGCSGFVSEVLGIDWKSANDIMGANPNVSIGRPPYNTSALTPGDIVGWYNGSGSGHVAVFIGESDCRFIDVKEDNATNPLPPRKVMQYENSREVFKSRNY